MSPIDPATERFTKAGAIATSLARYRLGQGDRPDPIDDDTWPLVLTRIADEKLTGIAVAAADDGWLPAREGQYGDLVASLRDAMTWSLDLERRLLEVADAFTSAGIDFAVLKGPAIAHTTYADPSWRPFNDIDLLVRARQWDDACRMLGETFGWPRRLPEPRRGFDVRFGKSAVFTTTSRQQIDLHRTLAQGPFGVWIDADDLFGMLGSFRLAGRDLPCLDPTGRFVHACIHGVLGDAHPTLIQHRDVVQTWRSGIDERRMRTLTTAWRIGPVIERAVRRAAVLDPGLGATVGRVSSDPAARRALAAYGPARRARGGMELATLRALPGVRPRLEYARDLVFPGGDFAQARGRGRWATPLRWLWRPEAGR